VFPDDISILAFSFVSRQIRPHEKKKDLKKKTERRLQGEGSWYEEIFHSLMMLVVYGLVGLDVAVDAKTRRSSRNPSELATATRWS
jgi:hypothetical protein